MSGWCLCVRVIGGIVTVEGEWYVLCVCVCDGYGMCGIKGGVCIVCGGVCVGRERV